MTVVGAARVLDDAAAARYREDDGIAPWGVAGTTDDVVALAVDPVSGREVAAVGGRRGSDS